MMIVLYMIWIIAVIYEFMFLISIVFLIVSYTPLLLAQTGKIELSPRDKRLGALGAFIIIICVLVWL